MSGQIEPTTGRSERTLGDVLAVTGLWALWALSVVPLVVLFLEFDGHLPACVGAPYYAKLYGHIFVYPATFGLFATAFLVQPWLHTVRSIRSLASPQRGRVVAFLACTIVGIVSFASWVDFTKATPALWSFEAAAKEDIANATIGEACQTLMARYKGCEQRQQPAEFAEAPCRASPPQNDEQGTRPLDTLKRLSLDGSRSYTEWAYYVGFIANTTWIALLFGVVVARTGTDDRSLLGQTTVAIGLATAWVIFRATFLVEKMDLYNDPLLTLNFLIFFAFVVLYLHMLHLYVRGLRSKIWNLVSLTGHVIVAVVTCLAAVLGPLIDAGWLVSGKAILIPYFGSESSLLVYITMLLLFLVMVAPAVVKRLWGNQEQ